MEDLAGRCSVKKLRKGVGQGKWVVN